MKKSFKTLSRASLGQCTLSADGPLMLIWNYVIIGREERRAHCLFLPACIAQQIMKVKHLSFPDHKKAKPFNRTTGHKLENILAKQIQRLRTGLFAVPFEFYIGSFITVSLTSRNHWE